MTHTHNHRHETSGSESCAHTQAPDPVSRAILTIRSHTGISGDIFLAGLAALHLQKLGMNPDGPEAASWLAELGKDIMPEFSASLRLRRHLVNGISGWQAQVELLESCRHRTYGDIVAIIEASAMSDEARRRAEHCFELLAACEAEVHGIAPEEVHFHEAGALDSILDICAACQLFTSIGSPALVAAPLPLADGSINCAHGILPAPAPAVLKLLRNMPVRPFAGKIDAGELVTPTGLALLRGLSATFGPWPEFVVEQTAVAYGQREFEGTANGVIFVLGHSRLMPHV